MGELLSLQYSGGGYIWRPPVRYAEPISQTHPLRAAARFMKQKADHHLEFLADKNGKSSHPILPPLSAVGDGPIKRQLGVGGSIHTPVHPSPLGRAASLVPYGEGVTAGESDDDGMKATQKDGESSRPRAAEGRSRPKRDVVYYC